MVGNAICYDDQTVIVVIIILICATVKNYLKD